MHRLAHITSHLSDMLNAERDRWPLWIPVLIGVGIAGYFSLKIEPDLWVGGAWVLASGIVATVLRTRLVLLRIFVAVTIIGIGFSAAQVRTISSDHIRLTERHGPATVIGKLIRVEKFPGSQRITLEYLRISSLSPDRTPDRIRIRLRGAQPDMLPGDWIKTRAILSPPPAPAAPGAFDFQRRAYFMRLGASGFAFGAAERTARPETALTVNIQIEKLRQRLGDRIRTAIGGEAGAIASALMTGDRSALSEKTLAAFRDSGLAHILAISGLHVGLMAGILFFTVRALLALVPRFAVHYPIKKWAAVFAILGAFSYAMIAGATIPTQRAFLMIALGLTAIILDRQGISMRLVAWAATIILIFEPESLLSASFQMSFSAVVALIAAYEAFRLRRRPSRESAHPVLGRLLLYFAGVALTTIIASTATAAFAMFHFNRVAVFALVANLVAVPITALWVMPLAMLSFALMPFGLESLLLVPQGWGISIILWIAETVGDWTGSVVTVPAAGTWVIAIIAAGGLWLCLWRRRWRYAGIIPLIAGLIGFSLSQPPDVLVEGSGRLFAVRAEDGSYRLSTRRAAKFSGEIWLRRVGADPQEIPPWPRKAGNNEAFLKCDDLGCIYKTRDKTVALVRSPLALNDDCRRADIVVSAVPVQAGCPSAEIVIDRFDLWREGAHGIWIEKSGARVESVNALRGKRPWVLRPTSGR